MIATRADLRLSLSSIRNNSANLGGGLTASVLRDLVFVDGVQADGSRAINRQIERENINVPSGGSFSLDLQTTSAPPDTTAGLVAVRALYMRAAASNSGPILLDPTVSNGWNTELTGTIRLEPGAEHLLLFPATTANVSGTEKVVQFTNAGIADRTLESLLILGATA